MSRGWFRFLNFGVHEHASTRACARMLGRAEGWLRLVVLKDVRVSCGDAQDESMSLSALAELSRGSKELEISDCRGGFRRIIFGSTLVLCGACCVSPSSFVARALASS